MRFSDTFLRQVRDRVSIADYAGKRLAWDKRKSRPAAGDFWACCPFHQEKTASFHVLDAKGIYNCFGCSEKGDVFTLAMRLEGLSFPEAVKRMVELAGMELPEDDYTDRVESDRRKRLMSAVAKAAALYSSALESRDGKEARDYLAKRGFNLEECARFGIGFAPDGWSWLSDKLKGEFQFSELVEAGLTRDGDRGPLDTFRNRITFEICDPAGKITAFGGRALDPNQPAKYINSPETQLYSKSRILYRLKQARELLAKTKAQGLVVGEGYLDVIAFERAGVAAVAPCGTALTDEQLQLLWRSGGEPTLCFDGDTAGRRAADRALDLALPHLGPGRTVKIALMPEGQDPDDVYRNAGAEALKGMIAAALPASDALFEREKARRPLTTPEARAALKASLREAANKIADADTRKLYLSDLLTRADAASRTPRAEWKPGGFRKDAPLPPTAELKAIATNKSRPAAENFLRAAIDHPGLLARHGDWIDRLHIPDPELDAIRTALLQLSTAETGSETIDRPGLSRHLQRSGEERAAARVSRWPKPKPVSPNSGETDEPGLEAEWLALATREVVLPAIREELAELRPLIDQGDDAAFVRFQALASELRAIEARAREAKPSELKDDDADDLVA